MIGLVHHSAVFPSPPDFPTMMIDRFEMKGIVLKGDKRYILKSNVT